MVTVLITKEMLDNLEYDPTKSAMSYQNEAANIEPTALFIFDSCDLNAAIYHLQKSLHDPFAPNSIATVLIQESIREEFIAKLQTQLKAPSAEVANNVCVANALETIDKLKLRTIHAANINTPSLVCDVTHEQLGGSLATGIVTVHTFRTAKEAIALFEKESLKFNNVSIWHQNHSCAYEIVAAIGCRNYYINCFKVSLEPLKTGAPNFVTMDKNFHYETMTHNGFIKNIVFPIGTIFAN